MKKGDRVSWVTDGVLYTGTISNVYKDGFAYVKADQRSQGNIHLSRLSVL